MRRPEKRTDVYVLCRDDYAEPWRAAVRTPSVEAALAIEPTIAARALETSIVAAESLTTQALAQYDAEHLTRLADVPEGKP